NKVYWSSFNVYRFKQNHEPELAQSPLEAGSFFRRASYDAILESNNSTYPAPKIPAYRFTGDAIPQDNNPETGTFSVLKEGQTSTTPLTWKQTEVNNATLNKDWKIGGGYEIADVLDFYALASPDDQSKALNWPIGKAYGVVYADGATTVQTEVNKAHGYTRADGISSEKGMRGIIIYNSDYNYRQIFLPLGASGYGRRKGSKVTWAKPYDYIGTMRYASRAYYYYPTSAAQKTVIDHNPLFWDIFRRPGAVYWCRRWQANDYAEGKNYFDVRRSNSFDMNYFTMGFEGMLNDACSNENGTGSDALFIRTIKRNE
ncbi:MAG: hypothetical protein K2J38_06825, partial [Muribaculaceae bacterium]|nr:hypothetical protein [Muribaculaceae bacterium]